MIFKLQNNFLAYLQTIKQELIIVFLNCYRALIPKIFLLSLLSATP